MPLSTAPPPGLPALWAAGAGIAGLGCALALTFAVRESAFGAPDEPAHVNYAAQLAWTGRLPAIAPGDWDAARVAEVAGGDRDELSSIFDIAYEDHQPPLYYALVAPWATGVQRSPFRFACKLVLYTGRDWGPVSCRERSVMNLLRALSVVLGVATVAAALAASATVWRSSVALPLGSAAFIAFLPMVAYMSGMANNDALANLVMALALLAAVRRLAGRTTRRRYVVRAGLVWGAALLTKLTVYPVILPLAAAEVLRTRREGAPMRGAVAAAAKSAAVGLLIAAPWFVRNMRVYGLTDPFGLAAHDRVVVGQPRTVDWIAQHGWAAYLERAVVFTFDSFWGVFGWMSAFLDRRIYAVLAVASVVMAIGFAGYLRRAWRAARDVGGDDGGDIGPLQRDALVVFGLVCLTTVAGFVWYNLSFVQHQGRYLFPALIPIATAAMLGIAEWGRWLARAAGRPAWAGAIGAVGMAGFDAGLLATSIWALRYAIPTLWPAG